MTVKLKVPPAVGVPLSTPAGDRVRPAGSAPAVTAKPYGATPPAAVIVWLYAAATVAFGIVAGLTVTGTSSLVMVPTPVASEMVALTAPLRPTVKVSLASGVMSPLTSTVMVRVTWPGVKVSVPVAAV